MSSNYKSTAFLLIALLSLLTLLVACGGEPTPTSAPASGSNSTNPTVTLAPTTTPPNLATATPVILPTLAATSPAAKPSPAPADQLATPAPLSSPAIRPTQAGPGLDFIAAPTYTALPGTSPRPTAAAGGNLLTQYNPAPLAAFNLKNAVALGLQQKTIARLENIAIGSGVSLSQRTQPATERSIALVASSWKIAPPLIWCDDSAAKVQAAWSALNFSLSLDDQPVDLKPYQTVDFEESGLFCRAIDVALGTIPPGVHRLNLTRNLSRELDSGLLKDKIASGDYVYQMSLISFAANPNAPQNAKLADFKPGSSQDGTYQLPSQFLGNFSDAQEQFKPGTFKYTAAIFAGIPYGLVGGWCAKDQATLEENWKKMSYTATLNGQNLDLSKVPQYDRQRGTQACRLWDLNATPPEGQHKLVIKLNFSGDTNDGAGTYAAGDYITEYTILSVKLGTP